MKRGKMEGITTTGTSSATRTAFQTLIAVNVNNSASQNSFISSSTSSKRSLYHYKISNPSSCRHLLPTTTALLSANSSTKSPGTNKSKNESKISPTPEFRLQPTTKDRNWMFYDIARVLVVGGTGGNGIVAFRREKCAPLGGPAGGSGGSGGNVIFTASVQSGGNTLSKFRSSRAFRAQGGANGLGKNKHGEGAQDIYISIPKGTIIRNEEDKLLADLKEEGETFIAARGGRGGRGNGAFKTDRNRAPRSCEMGEPGVERWLRLELKLVADVGLVGLPNAGKSSLLDCVSNARPKVAAYEFTTVVPNLGVVDNVHDGADGLVIADVPGLIDGAHRGVGMGLAFLRHVERCKVVVHLIDGSVVLNNENELLKRYKLIRNELELFDKSLAEKKEVLLITKCDIPGVLEEWEDKWKQLLIKECGHKRIAVISSKNRYGIIDVMKRLRSLVENTEMNNQNNIILGDEDDENIKESVIVERISKNMFRVGGYKIKKSFEMTNWDYVENVDRFQRILQALQVNEKLKELGAEDGDQIECFEKLFDYYREENVYSAAAALDGFTD